MILAAINSVQAPLNGERGTEEANESLNRLPDRAPHLIGNEESDAITNVPGCVSRSARDIGAACNFGTYNETESETPK